MHLSHLTLHNFRNYSHLKLDLAASPVVLVGRNGAGKTNILEAISFLLPGRGLRRASLSEIDRSGHPDGWGVVAEINQDGEPVEITTGRESSPTHTEKRIVKIDGKPAKSQQELSRHVSMLWLIPAMDQLFTDTDSNRRKFLDRLVLAFDPEHAARVHRYEHAMRERNRLLSEPSYDPAWVSVLESNMVEEGIAIARARQTTVHHLNEAISASDLSFPKARIHLSGFCEDHFASGTDTQSIAAQATAKLMNMRQVDAAAGRCVFGLHRCEMHTRFDVRGTPAAHCSTGEQKALLLSILIGQARAVRRHKGKAPILLLDEVVAHLDASRRAELSCVIFEQNIQAFLTGTDRELFCDFETKAQFFEICSGPLIRSIQ